GLGDAGRVPSGLCRFAGEAVTRKRWDDDVEGVIGAAAVRSRIGQGLDDFELFDDRAWPAMGDDDRHGVFMLGLYMDEVKVQPVDLRGELRVGVQFRFDFAPVVVLGPVVGELPDGSELDAL